MVRQVVGVWRTYFPLHIVPHIYPSSGSQRVALRVIDSAGHRSALATQDVNVTDNCLEWGGPLAFLFDHSTTCDTTAVLAPRRRPDYYALDFNVEVGLAAFGVTATVAYGGDVFIAIHGAVGAQVGFRAGAVLEGFVGPPNGATPPLATILSFVNGVTVPIQAALGPFGLAGVLSPGCDKCADHPGRAVEYSVGPGLSLGASLGASCAIDIGPVLGVSDLAPSDPGPWPHNGGRTPRIAEPALHRLERIIMASLRAWQLGCQDIPLPPDQTSR